MAWAPVQTLTDGNDTTAIREAIHNAQAETARPSLIKIRTHIGYGSPNKIDTAAAHGSPLGAEELKLVKKGFGFNPDESFVIPETCSNSTARQEEREPPSKRMEQPAGKL